MPRFNTYQTQTDIGVAAASGRRATAEDFGGGAGLQDLAQGLETTGAVIEKRQTQADLSTLHANMATAQGEWTVELQKRLQASDGSDPNLATNFLKDFQDYVGKLGEGAQTDAGRQYVAETSAELQSHFAVAASQGQAALAGAKAKRDVQTTVDAQSAALINDPSQFEMSLRLQQKNIDGLVAAGTLPASAAAGMKDLVATDLAKAALQGWIQANPAEAKKQLASGKWDDYLTGDLKTQLDGQADQQIRAIRVDAELAYQQAQRAKAEAQMATSNDFVSKWADGALTSKEVLASNLDPAAKEHWLGNIKTQVDAGQNPPKTDPTLFSQLFDRIHLPDGNPNKITNEEDLNQYVNRGISFDDLNNLRGEVQNKRTTAGQQENDLQQQIMNAAKQALDATNPLLGIRDPQGAVQLGKFQAWFLTEYQKQRQGGKSPMQLLDPDSPDSLYKGINQFKRDPVQMMRDIMADVPADITGDGSTTPAPSAPAPAANDIASQATKKATLNGQPIYLVNGKWVDKDGNAVNK